MTQRSFHTRPGSSRLRMRILPARDPGRHGMWSSTVGPGRRRWSVRSQHSADQRQNPYADKTWLKKIE